MTRFVRDLSRFDPSKEAVFMQGLTDVPSQGSAEWD